MQARTGGKPGSSSPPAGEWRQRGGRWDEWLGSTDGAAGKPLVGTHLSRKDNIPLGKNPPKGLVCVTGGGLPLS